jgi:hypothetical protein
VELEPRAEKRKLNCLLEPEPKLQIAAPAPAPTDLKKFYLKNHGAEEVFVNCYNFNLIT